MIMYVGMVWLCGVNCWFMGDCALLFFVKMVGNVIAFMSIWLRMTGRLPVVPVVDGQDARSPDG